MVVGGEDQWELRDVFRDSRQQMRHVVGVMVVLLSRKVTYEEGAKFAKDNNLLFL